MNLSLRFVSTTRFLDPMLTKDGKPYGPFRYREIVKECYVISKNTNTSYTDLMSITPLERKFIIEFLFEESQKTREMLEEAKRGRESRSRNR